MMDDARLKKTLGSPHLAWIFQKLRRRLERGDEIPHSIRLPHPTPEQHDAYVRLFGSRATLRGTLTVKTACLEELLRNGQLCDGIAAAVEAVTGPIVNRAAERCRYAAVWDAVFQRACEQVAARSALEVWLRDPQTQAWVRRICLRDPKSAGQMLDRALRVIVRLPASGIPLAELAATVAGDSHALDADQPLARLVLRGAAHLSDVDSRDSAASCRMAWERLGVLVDELSAPALVLNLKGDAGTTAGRALLLHAAAGEPYRLSVRQLLRHPPVFSRGCVGDRVFVCENPSVIGAAADRLGAGSAPLVCLEGQPKTACTLLLQALADAGIALCYHGDFDWPGIQIANLVMDRHGVTAWQFDAAAYERTSGGTVLRGAPVAAIWDPRLEPAMLAAGRAVHEEQLLDRLLEDLSVQTL